MGDAEKELDQIFKYYVGREKAMGQEELVELLREIQDLLGCIPEDVQERAADASGIGRAAIRQLIKLYPSLTSAPRRHKVTVCTGQRCGARGADDLLKAVRRELRSANGFAGGRFFLKVQNCMKRCGCGPNMVVDDDEFQGVKPEEVKEILERYR